MISRLVSRFAAIVTIATFAGAQMPSALAQTAPSAALAPAQSTSAVASSVTVLAGTQIPLTLINPIHSKSSKSGDAVRATVAFPVTVGGVVAIPAGSYVEGTLTQVTPQPKNANQPKVDIHFTRLLFPNGYAVPLDAENTQAALDAPAMFSAPLLADTAASIFPGMFLLTASFLQTTQPTLPPLPQEGPSMGAVMGATFGGAAALLLTLFLIGHHRAANLDYTLYDAGWQFQIALASPVTIDLNRAK